MTLGVAAAGCAHGPSGTASRENSVHFSIHAAQALRVVLILLDSGVPAPVPYEVEARKGPDGLWWAESDLKPGEYRYFFLVDGTVRVGPGGRVEADDFGGLTGIVTVRESPAGGLEAF